MTANRWGPFTIVEKLGQGGMGSVFKAFDTELDRIVALKRLNERHWRTPGSEGRLRREARVIAGLRHPRIVTVYSLEWVDGEPGLVMEYVDGQTLDKLIPPGGLDLARAIDLARQLVDVLAFAAEANVIHRDLKPANIMVTAGDQIKVLDFGLAKVMEHADGLGQSSADVDSTVVLPSSPEFTYEGIFAGTPQYMSPEQAEGHATNWRTDVFSAGAVMYEMFTGERAFSGATRVQVVASVIRDWPLTPSHHNPAIPPRIDRLILRCLEKDPVKRFSTPAEFVEHAKSAFAVSQRNKSAPIGNARRISLWIAALSLMIAGLWYSLPKLRQKSESTDTFAVKTLMSDPGAKTSPSFSPDGRQVAFSWRGAQDDNDDIYVLPVDGGAPRRLTHDPAADLYPAWSPDGDKIAFIRGSAGKPYHVMTMHADGSGEQTLTGINFFLSTRRRTLDWSPDGRWLAFHDSDSADEERFSLFLLSMESGEKRQITVPRLNEGQSSPVFSPDGRTIAYVRDREGVTSLALLHLFPNGIPDASPMPIHLTGYNKEFCGNPAWTADGKQLVFNYTKGGQNHLWRVPVPSRPDEEVEPRLIVPSGAGSIEPIVARVGRRLAFIHRIRNMDIWEIDLSNARHPQKKLPSPAGVQRFGQFSPDGRMIAFESDRNSFPEIWVSDPQGLSAQQITRFRGPVSGSPSWSPDGRWIAFDTRFNDQPDIYIAPYPSNGSIRRFTANATQDNMPAWSPDGKFIYFNSNRDGPFQIWRMPVEGGHVFRISRKTARAPVASPDGRFVYFGVGSRELSELWRANVNGGGEIRIAEGIMDRGYAPTANGVYALKPTATGAAELWLFNDSLRDPHLITKLGGRIAPGLAISPDGRTALVTRLDESKSDLMLIDGFH